MMLLRIFIPVAFVLLTGCAGMPEFDTSAVDRSLTPQSVIAEPELSRGKVALWGGTILETRNLKDATQIEILAYPLDADYRPMPESKPLGRFIIRHSDYLEPTTYAQGKYLTVMGTVTSSQTGNVGETTYTYPVISDSQLHLWTQSSRSRSSVHFGFGLGIGL
jgi:outer membrane lipoprotein